MSIINNRYSVRTFDNREVEENKIIQIVEAGMLAPSSKSKAPWQFIVLSDKNLIAEFAAFHKNWSILKTANKAIIVCGDLNCDEREKHTLMACSAASENILLKVVELDLGAVWLGLYPDEARIQWTKEKLNIPDNIIPISLIAIGYSDNKKQRERLVDTNKIHFNKW